MSINYIKKWPGRESLAGSGWIVCALDALDLKSSNTYFCGAKPSCCLIREVEFAPVNVRAPILHNRDDTFPGLRIGEFHFGTEWEGFMGDDMWIVHIVATTVCHGAPMEGLTVPRRYCIPLRTLVGRHGFLFRRCVLLFGLNALFVVIEHIEAKKDDCNGCQKSTDQLFSPVFVGRTL